MRDYAFDYTIWKDNSPEQFKKACASIERAFPDVDKEKLLVDVDGSTVQVYALDGKEAVVFDDYDVGAVFAKSDFDLSAAFTQQNIS